ncbi:DedA family protein [Devriesea agamarum]|uniref:DedA family protein n=1 Tax=Devriesea agamarum TaxID=472569 RepID=UPI0009FC28EF|nr:DedA family protein [Devriesea agamarum]
MGIAAWLQDLILHLSGSPWTYPVVLIFSLVDGFFPTVPSESVLVGLGSLWASQGAPMIWLVIICGWIGAVAGDNIAYMIGRRVGWQRFRFLRSGRGLRAVEAAERGLERRALLFLMTARYIPMGRTAVNFVAGALRYPHRKFFHRTLLSCAVWALYSCGIGALAGQWFANHHLLGIAVALVLAVVVSVILERVVHLVHRILDARADQLIEPGASPHREDRPGRDAGANQERGPGHGTNLGHSRERGTAGPGRSDKRPIRRGTGTSHDGRDEPEEASDGHVSGSQRASKLVPERGLSDSRGCEDSTMGT